MSTLTDKISGLKGLLESGNFNLDVEEDDNEVETKKVETKKVKTKKVETKKVGTKKVETKKVETKKVKEDNFTIVGLDGKPLKEISNPDYSNALKVGLPIVDESVTTELIQKEKELKSQTFLKSLKKPQVLKFGTVDKRDFDKSLGDKPNYMLNPELFQKAVFEMSKRIGVDITPDIDLFADQNNKQPNVKKFYHFNHKYKFDENYDAFTKDWSIYKNVYANFYWGKMHEVILKAKSEGVNLLTFLDVSPKSSSLEYFKLYKEYSRIQYKFSDSDVNDLWVHASETGYDKFLKSHLPSFNGEYALCFFNFGENKIVKNEDIVVNKVSSGRLQHTITTQIKVENGEKLSAHTSEDGTVSLTRSLDGAKDITHRMDKEVLNDYQISNEGTIKSLEIEIENIFKEKTLDDDLKSLHLQLFQKKKASFDKELKIYSEWLQNFHKLL